MKKRSIQFDKAARHLLYFKPLTAYMAKVAKGTAATHGVYSLCVKSSVCKCFEFNMAIRHVTNSRTALFAMSSLRGMCEDLIVLRYILKMPPTDRNTLMIALMRHDLTTRIKLQTEFFATIRPQQPVVGLKNVDAVIASQESAARAIWNRHGWPNLQNGAMPQVRQIAEKQGLDQLAILYDYLYRLTSAAVHFNVHALLRLNWSGVFSSKNFVAYFEDYCSLYGAFMFCLYFEFFGTILRPDAKTRAAVAKIRQMVLWADRWPEMVTHEELGMRSPTHSNDLPRLAVNYAQGVSRKKLIVKGLNYKNKRNAERRLVENFIRGITADDWKSFESVIAKRASRAGVRGKDGRAPSASPSRRSR